MVLHFVLFVKSLFNTYILNEILSHCIQTDWPGNCISKLLPTRSIMCNRRNNFRLVAIPQDLWRRDRPDMRSSRFVEHSRYPRLPRGLRISQGYESLRERWFWFNYRISVSIFYVKRDIPFAFWQFHLATSFIATHDSNECVNILNIHFIVIFNN